MMINWLSHPIVLRIGFLIALLLVWPPTHTYASNLPQCTGDYWHNCQGTFIYAKGNKYVGEWQDSTRNGQGTIFETDGSKYFGEWKDNKKNGQGVYTYADGDKYVGEWKDDKKNGQGAYTYADGDKYVGGWRYNEPIGQGTFTYADGNKYLGEWKDYTRNGLYTVSYINGDTFSGNYISGKRQGQGTFTWKDGSRYVGRWWDGKPTADGLHTSATGTVLRDVKYTNAATYYYTKSNKHGLMKSADILTYEISAAKDPIAASVLCSIALNNLKNDWDPTKLFEDKVQEAKRLGLSIDDCRKELGLVRLTTQTSDNLSSEIDLKCRYWADFFDCRQALVLSPLTTQTDDNSSVLPYLTANFLCRAALTGDFKDWDPTKLFEDKVQEAKRRGLSIDDCRVALQLAPLTTQTSDSSYPVTSLSAYLLCAIALNSLQNDWDPASEAKVQEAKRRGLSVDDCRLAHGLAPLTTQTSDNSSSGIYLQCRYWADVDDCRRALGLAPLTPQTSNNSSSGIDLQCRYWADVDNCRRALGLAPLTSQADSNSGSHASNLPECTGNYWDNCQGAASYDDGGKYVGEFKGNKYDGQGTFTFASGNKYVGQFKDAKRNGQGSFTFTNGNKYVGDFKDNARHGQGTFTFASGDEYAGDWKDYKRSGFFAVSYVNGDSFSGGYLNDKRQGQGTYLWNDGSKYVGQWADGVPTLDGLHTSAKGLSLGDIKYTNAATYYNNGILKSADVLTHEVSYAVASDQKNTLAKNLCNYSLRVDRQNWDTDTKYKNYVSEAKRRGLSVDDCRVALQLAPLNTQADSNSGLHSSNLPECRGNYSYYSYYYSCQGTHTNPDGSKYVGEFKDGQYNGQGTYTWANGTKYVGEWKDDKRNGQGTYTYANGTKAVGEWKDDKRNGQGTITLANGNSYVGEYKDNKFNGQGTYTFADGDKYVGEFKDHKRNGLFTVSYAIGDVFSGNYISDKRQGQGTFIWKDGSKYVGQWAEGVPTVDGLHASASGTVLRDVKYTNTATYYGDGSLMSVDVLTYEAPAVVVAQQTVQQTVQVVQPISPTKVDIGKRVALVIGNDRYQSVPILGNAVRDGKAISSALLELGFEKVTFLQDLSRNGISDALKSFSDDAEQADWAAIYYSGHGIEMGGVNYLIPVDATLKRDRDVPLEAIELDKVLAAASGAKKLKLVIVDGCRNNPFLNTMRKDVASKSIGRGLAAVEPEVGTLVVFAAKHGQEALDGVDGTNSPFAAALLQRIKTPGLEIRRLFDLVRDDVIQSTGKAQQPFSYGSLSGSQDFYFSVK